MENKIIIHTDASNIKNSNICKIALIIEHNTQIKTITDYLPGKISHAELIAALHALLAIEKDYNPKNFSIELFTDHLPNAKLLNKIMAENEVSSEGGLAKINSILIRKGLNIKDISVISRLQNSNTVKIIWISRKENKIADRLSRAKTPKKNHNAKPQR